MAHVLKKVEKFYILLLTLEAKQSKSTFRHIACQKCIPKEEISWCTLWFLALWSCPGPLTIYQRQVSASWERKCFRELGGSLRVLRCLCECPVDPLRHWNTELEILYSLEMNSVFLMNTELGDTVKMKGHWLWDERGRASSNLYTCDWEGLRKPFQVLCKQKLWKLVAVRCSLTLTPVAYMGLTCSPTRP